VRIAYWLFAIRAHSYRDVAAAVMTIRKFRHFSLHATTIGGQTIGVYYSKNKGKLQPIVLTALGKLKGFE
jgi:hypothetical protein